MPAKLTSTDLSQMLQAAEAAFPHGACLTCECFLGYVAQLRLDADEGGKEFLTKYKVDRHEIHSCLGCDPCPPGNLSVAYASEKRKNTLFTL